MPERSQGAGREVKMTIQAKFKVGSLLKHRIENRYIVVCGFGERAKWEFPEDIPMYVCLQLIEGRGRKVNLGIVFVEEYYRLIRTP